MKALPTHTSLNRFIIQPESYGATVDEGFIVGGPVGDFELLLCHGTVCVVGKMRDLILQLSKSSIYSTKPTLIHIRVRSDLWRKWSTESLRVPENVTRHLYLDHTFAAIQAAEDSLGIALVPQIFCEKHLTSGRLVMLNEFGTLISGTYFLVMQTNIKPGIQEFSEWLGKNIAAAREQP